MNNRIPWKRIFAEGAAIVVSILLAFSIEAWWSGYQDRSKERIVLLGLKSEFEDNLKLIDVEIKYREVVSDSILKMFEAAESRATIDPDELDRLLGAVTWWSNVVYSRGTIEDLIQGGELSLISNPELRRLVASLPSTYDRTTHSELNDQITTNEVVIPYLNDHASLSQIANTMEAGRPGTGRDSVAPVYPTIGKRDHSELLRDQEFLGVLVQEHWNHLEANIAYLSLSRTLEHGIDLIEIELND